jgi:hypothetical protein
LQMLVSSKMDVLLIWPPVNFDENMRKTRFFQKMLIYLLIF